MYTIFVKDRFLQFIAYVRYPKYCTKIYGAYYGFVPDFFDMCVYETLHVSVRQSSH
jgi:hypothetical protein